MMEDSADGHTKGRITGVAVMPLLSGERGDSLGLTIWTSWGVAPAKHFQMEDTIEIGRKFPVDGNNVHCSLPQSRMICPNTAG